MKVPVQIVDLSRGAIVDAEMFDDVTFDHFVQTQREWRPMTLALLLKKLPTQMIATNTRYAQP